MPRFVHTADWQLGHSPATLDRLGRGRAHDQRFTTVEAIGRLAADEDAAFVVVAGDVFADNQVPTRVVDRARRILAAFPCPVLLLPGHRDPAETGGALARLLDGAPPHLRILGDQPVTVGGVVVHGCPLTRRDGPEDPTTALPARDDESLRIVVAHGGVHHARVESQSSNRIDTGLVMKRGFDYLALGHWHGALEVGPGAWYSGSPEPRGFDEPTAGQVLVVDLTAPGASPTVTPTPVAAMSWQRQRATLAHRGSVDDLDTRLGALERPEATAISLRLAGSLSVADRVHLHARLAHHRTALLHLELVDEDLLTRLDDAAPAVASPFLAEALRRLRLHPDPAAMDAARLLHRLTVGEVA